MAIFVQTIAIILTKYNMNNRDHRDNFKETKERREYKPEGEPLLTFLFNSSSPTGNGCNFKLDKSNKKPKKRY